MTKIQFRRDTAANWTTANSVLGAGEPGFETDTGKEKRGDGTTAWNNLAYFTIATVVAIGNRLTGETDDTLAINRALALAGVNGGMVIADSRKPIYTVTPQGAGANFVGPSGTTSTLQVCLSIPSNVTLDMRGTTLKLGGSTPATIVANSNMTVTGTRNTNVGLVNAVLDGSGLVLTNAGLWTFAHVSFPHADGVRITNGVYQGAYMIDVDNGTFGVLDADNFQGQPFALGAPSGTSNQIYDSHFGTIRARNITALNGGSQPGNSVAAVLTRCTIDNIEARTCAAGIKIQGPGTDSHIGRAVSWNTGDSSGNSGFKFQGDTGNSWYPVRMTVDVVESYNSTGTGLYMDYSIDCAVGTYIGYGNNTLGTGPDVWIGGTRDSVGIVKSDRAGGNSLLIRSYATDARIDEIKAVRPGQVVAATNKAGVAVAGGSCSIGSLVAVDDQGTPTMTYGLNEYGGTSVVKIGYFKSSGHVTGAYSVSSPNVDLSLPLGVGMGLKTGVYIPCIPTTGITTSNTLGAGLLKVAPFVTSRTSTISSFVIEVTVAGDGGSAFRLGIYGDDGSGGYPKALLLDAGTIDCTTTGVKELTFGTPLVLGAGNYWVGGALQGSPTTQPTFRIPSSAMVAVGYPTLPGTGAAALGYTQTGITSTLPTTFTTSISPAGQVVRVWAKITA